MAGLIAIGAMTPSGAPQAAFTRQLSAEPAMLLECLAITLVFALTCGAVLIFMKARRYDC
jgi:hypothetical protein